MATIKQKRAIQNIVENHGNVSKGMREAGYSPATAKNPKNLTESNGWKKLLDEYVQDEDVVKIHKGLLDAQIVKTYSFPKSYSDREIKEIIESVRHHKVRNIETRKRDKLCYYSVPDYAIIIQAVKLVHKLKNRYPTRGNRSEQKDVVTNIQIINYGIQKK